MTNLLDDDATLTRPGRPDRHRFSSLARPGTAVAALAAVAIVLAACGSSSPNSAATTTTAANTGNSGAASSTTATTGAASASDTVKEATTSKGTILEDSAGMPLYTLAAGTSCTGACAQAWPFVTVPAGTTPKAGPGVTGTLGTTTTGGANVVTYNGKELYTFLSDSAGQVTGDGIAGFSVAKVAAASGAANQTPATTKPPATTTTARGGYQY
jgi:predicted lipoprotein with Yx(FWY)xxD motif